MKTFRDLKEQAVRQNFRLKHVFTEGEVVMNSLTGVKGKIIRTGPNYVICVTESDEMFRAWIRDIREVNDINKPRRTTLFTHGQANTINISSS
tara:strand:+ start:2349 stop:2627 length:279 start_codon:yes stop_codon:yes gene_type:complete